MGASGAVRAGQRQPLRAARCQGYCAALQQKSLPYAGIPQAQSTRKDNTEAICNRTHFVTASFIHCLFELKNVFFRHRPVQHF